MRSILQRVAVKGQRFIRKVFLSLHLRSRNQFSRERVTGEAGAVVSLTTYGQRTQGVYLTIESIAAGKVRPRRLILWIDEAETIANLPNTLRRLQSRGLEILQCENYGPHKKYYPYVISTGRDVTLPLVTADDDMFYPQSWLQELLSRYNKSQGHNIVAHRSRTLQVDAQDDQKIAKYSAWSLTKTMNPRLSNFSTGTGGVIYPPRMLQALKERGDSFVDDCRNTDDLWLHSTAVGLGIKTMQVTSSPANYLMTFRSQDVALFKINHQTNGNDQVFDRIYSAVAKFKLLSEIKFMNEEL